MDGTSKGQTTEDQTKSADDAPLWAIEDTLFYPKGLINHSTGRCRYIFVTWSEDYLLNYVCKGSSKTRVRRVTIPKKTINCDENDYDDYILKILILKLNTLLLMRSGNVYYFSSVKSIHSIHWLNCVRCISPSHEGFCLIRLLPNNKLALEVYRDVINLGKCTTPSLLRRFDITFDECNIFNCQWQDESFTLTSQEIQPKYIEFLEQVIRCEYEIKDIKEIYFFSVSCSVFVLVPANNEDCCHIQLLNTYTSRVECVKVLVLHQLVLVFLECGTIDVWYISNAVQSVRHKTHHTGVRYAHHEFCESNCCLYYTDGGKVAEIKFHYDSTFDSCLVQETWKPISGVVACTWVDAIQKLICLSCNNIFYRVSFDNCVEGNIGYQNFRNPATAMQCENFEDIYELNPEKLSRLVRKAQVLEEIASAPARVQKSIEQELMKQQMMAMENKMYIYKKFITAKLEYHTSLPPCPLQGVTYVHSNRDMSSWSANNLLALLYIKSSLSDALQTSIWQLHIRESTNLHNITFPTNILKGTLCVVIPIRLHIGELLPQLDLKLLNFININSEILVIAVPIYIKQMASTYVHLFTSNSIRFHMFPQHGLQRVIRRYTNEPRNFVSPRLSYVIQLPTTTDLESVQKLFNLLGKCYCSAKSITISFSYTSTNSITTLKFLEDLKQLQIETNDAIALHYVKLFVYEHVKDMERDSCTANYNHIKAAKLILQFQSEVERCYGRVLEIDNPLSNILYSPNSLHVENLKRVYIRMRSDLCKMFR